MVLTTSLVIFAAIAFGVVLAEALRRAASGKEIEEGMRRTADLAPIAGARPRSLQREWVRRAA